MNCLIVDDEPLALDVLETFVNMHPDLNLVGKAPNAIVANEKLKTGKIDVIFLDIQMPEINGVNFVRSLKEKPMIVFTTAYSEYAVEGFELSAVDYLLKPISQDRFNQAVEKLKEYHAIKNNGGLEESAEIKDDHVFIKANQKLLKLAYNDIKYVEAFADYVKIFTTEKRIVTLQTMKKMDAKLPSDRFCRVHRSFIVNIDYIQSYSSNSIDIGEVKIPVGKNYKERFQTLIKTKNTL